MQTEEGIVDFPTVVDLTEMIFELERIGSPMIRLRISESGSSFHDVCAYFARSSPSNLV